MNRWQRQAKQPCRALFAGRVPREDGYADTPLLVERLREVGAGILEEVTIRNFSPASAECVIVLSIESNFADLFEVKEARIRRHWTETYQAEGDSLTIRAVWQGVHKAIVVKASGAEISPKMLSYRTVIPSHGRWSTRLSVVPGTDRTVPNPDRIVVAAGAPWFMTLFGRDSLWASGMALPVDPSLALGTLQTLAERQGRVVDPISEEDPGKILHEVRIGVSGDLLWEANRPTSAASTPLEPAGRLGVFHSSILGRFPVGTKPVDFHAALATVREFLSGEAALVDQ